MADAQETAISVLSWLAGEPELLGRFLALSGLEAHDLRSAAQDPGFFPGVPNFNEVLIHLNGLRYPWDYIRALRYRKLGPKCLAIKSAVVPPEYWDTGVAVLLFAEMASRAEAAETRLR